MIAHELALQRSSPTRSAIPLRGLGPYRRRGSEGLGPHSARNASRSWEDSVVSGKLGARRARSKKGCGQVFPRKRHPRTLRIARIMSHGLSPVDPSGG